MTKNGSASKKVSDEAVAEARAANVHYNLSRVYAKASEQTQAALAILIANEGLRAKLAKAAADKSIDATEAYDLLLLVRKHQLRIEMLKEWQKERTEL